MGSHALQEKEPTRFNKMFFLLMFFLSRSATRAPRIYLSCEPITAAVGGHSSFSFSIKSSLVNGHVLTTERRILQVLFTSQPWVAIAK